MSPKRSELGSELGVPSEKELKCARTGGPPLARRSPYRAWSCLQTARNREQMIWRFWLIYKVLTHSI